MNKGKTNKTNKINEQRVFAVGDLLLRTAHTHGLAYPLDLEVGDLDPVFVPKGRFQAFLTLRFLGDSIGALLEEGRLTVELKCSRCLESFVYPLSIASNERYFYLPGKTPADEVGEQFSLNADGKSIDISEMLRQEIILALPMHQLCPQKCRASCGRCGKKLASCRCSKANKTDSATHTPLADLRKLL